MPVSSTFFLGWVQAWLFYEVVRRMATYRAVAGSCLLHRTGNTGAETQQKQGLQC